MAQRTGPDSFRRLLEALAGPQRLRMIRLLSQHELAVGEVARAMQLPQSTASRHLQAMLAAGVLARRGEGTASLYRFAPEAGSDAASLWTLAQGHLDGAAESRQDDARLRAVLASRRVDSATFFGRVGAGWDSMRDRLFGQCTAPALVGLANPEWNAADVGCGTGQVVAALAPFVKSVVGFDREGAMVDACRKRLAGVANAQVRQGDALALPARAGEFDIVVSSLLYHHLERPQEAVAEAGRVLRPGGILLVIDMVRHRREEYLVTMGHRHLGFAPEEIAAWAARPMRHTRTSTLPADPEAMGPQVFVARFERGS